MQCLRDVILRYQDQQLLGRTKAEIRNSLRIDTETLSPQPALANSPVSGQASNGVATTTETDSPVPQGRESSPQSRDASSVHSAAVSSSLTRNHEPPEGQLLAEITSNLVDARKGDLEPTPSISPKPLSDSSTRSSPSHSHSPSIVNLGRRSVVRKRLAEMQHHSTSGTSPLRVSRRPALHRASHLISHERLAGNSESETVMRSAYLTRFCDFRSGDIVAQTQVRFLSPG